MAEPLRGVVLDIEGTTAPIAFVHRVLFPYAREHLPALLQFRAADPAVAAEVAAVREAVPDQEPLTTLLEWLDADVKAAPLKVLQGLLWRAGFEDGTLRAELYPDVAATLRSWHVAGLRLSVYSSGSVEAQKLLYGYSVDGDLSGLFEGFFDTRVGAKREAGSYRAVSAQLACDPATLLFLSDVEAELVAAAEADFAVCQLVRPEDGTVASTRFRTAATLPEAGRLFGLN